SLPTNQTCASSHRQKQAEYKERIKSGETTQNSVSSSTHYGSLGNSRYRRGGNYNSYDRSRRSSHRNNDIEVYRVQQQPAQYDSLMHPHSVNGLLRQHSWSGSNVSLGSNRSRSSTNQDHRSSGCSRHSDDPENAQLRTSSSVSVGSKLDEFDDSVDNNVTYVAAGTAPVSTFRGSSCGASSGLHPTAVPMTTYTAPVMPTGANGHSINAYTGGLNLPIDQRDLRHFDQGLPLLSSADELSSSAQLLFNQKGSASSRRCKDPAMLGKKVPAGIGRYPPDLDLKEDERVDLSQTQQQHLQQLNTAQLAALLGTGENHRNVPREVTACDSAVEMASVAQNSTL
ncbi:hypothetical protein OESDEN_11619, partial [Oesophagostomum dentatum]